MALLVVGSIGLDSVKTPYGEVVDVLGGSAVYFSVSASYFTDVKLVAIVGEDFPQEHIDLLEEKNIDLAGLECAKGKTFRWRGAYGGDLNEASTLSTHLNVFETFEPKLPEPYKKSDYVFLANIDPELQMLVQGQIDGARVVACDTMNFWIDGKRDFLIETLKNVDVFIINDGEARELAGESNLIKAAGKIMSYGPESLIVKRGEYGAVMFTDKSIFAISAYPLEDVHDPTGAGDSFAGGFMGHLARTGNLSVENMRQAVVFGSVMASYNVESFSLGRLKSLDYADIESRYKEIKELTSFEDI